MPLLRPSVRFGAVPEAACASTKTRGLHRAARKGQRQAQRAPSRLVAVSSSAQRDWDRVTVLELKDELASRGLKTSGLKQEMVDRLIAHELPVSAVSSSQPADQLPAEPPFDRFNEGELPPLDSVSLKELREELRRRGARTTGTKAQLYARLTEAAASASSAQPHADLSTEEMANWLLDRGVLPQGSSSDMSAMVDAGRLAEASLAAAARDSLVARMADPTFDPARLTVAELKDLLRSLAMDTSGNKADLVRLVRDAIERGAAATQTYRESAPEASAAGGDPRAVAVQQFLGSLDLQGLQAELQRRGQDASGTPDQVYGRLETLLLFEVASAPGPDSAARPSNTGIRARVRAPCFVPRNLGPCAGIAWTLGLPCAL